MNRLPLFLRSAPLLLGLLACEPTEREHGADVNPLDLPGNIVSGDSVLLRFAALPYTIKDQAEVSFPDSSLPALDSLASFLNKHPDHRLSVMGIYDARETKPGNGSDLGILRAINIKRILAERGIDTLSVSLLSRMDDLAFDNDGKISDGYRFRLMKDSLAAGSELNRTVY
ncbi:MAG TPA: hypothetical protein P5248_11310, partial [Bacteroidales bacterium]|nr:hypothetical protein [Bacteroidales bacterium]